MEGSVSENWEESGGLTAINVPGRNNAVKMAIIFILELSLARASVRLAILVASLACLVASSACNWLSRRASRFASKDAWFVAKDAWFAFKLERDAS
jgi:hypothetical protein